MIDSWYWKILTWKRFQIRDSTNSNIARPTAIAAMSPASSSPSLLNKNRSIRTRLGRSQSQSIFPISSKYPTQVQQKSLVNGTDDHSFTTVSNTHDPTKQPTSTATALMMINKQYPDTTNNPKSMTFYEKRQINYVWLFVKNENDFDILFF